MRSLIIGSALFAIAIAAQAEAAKVAGVELEDSAQISADTPKLVLNGAGVRKKLFIKVYVGALYLQNKATSVNAVLNQTGANRVLMHFLYKKVGRDKLVDGWKEGFSGNSSAAEMEKLQARLADFNGLFADSKKGDVILLDYLPGKGTRVTINGQAKGTIAGADFNKALLKVWLGSKPADSRLKEAMLGG
ncbi:MAG: chalcone isomerase family protein [Acidiferrobacterales bacterium]